MDILHNMFAVENWWKLVAAFCTLAIITYIYKDNILFKIAESVMVGVAAGYTLVVIYTQTLHTDLVQKLLYETENTKYLLIIPAILGIMLATRLFPRVNWLSRFPLSMMIGVGIGQSIPLILQGNVMEQIKGTARIDFVGEINRQIAGDVSLVGIFGILGGVVVVLGTICALIYFFFSKAHTGAFGGMAKFGIFILMIGFGASFGFTIQGRIALFADRVLFLLRDWMGVIT